MDTIKKALRIASLALEKNAVDLVLLNATDLCSYTDAIAICHGRSTRQVQTIVRHVAAEMKREGAASLGVEGEAEGTWALLDFGDVVLHVFYESIRHYYDLESIWPDAPRLEVPEQKDISPN